MPVPGDIFMRVKTINDKSIQPLCGCVLFGVANPGLCPGRCILNPSGVKLREYRTPNKRLTNFGRYFECSNALMFMIQGDRSAVEYRRNIAHNKIEPQRGSI